MQGGEYFRKTDELEKVTEMEIHRMPLENSQDLCNWRLRRKWWEVKPEAGTTEDRGLYAQARVSFKFCRKRRFMESVHPEKRNI